jgi:hypothetical protein
MQARIRAMTGRRLRTPTALGRMRARALTMRLARPTPVTRHLRTLLETVDRAETAETEARQTAATAGTAQIARTVEIMRTAEMAETTQTADVAQMPEVMLHSYAA